MTLSDFLFHAIRFVYALLGVVSGLSYLRRRDQVRLDIALLFGLFGLVNALQEYGFITGASPGRLETIFIRLVQIVHAYLLLRLIQHFRTVPGWILRVAIVGIVSLAPLAVLLPTWPAPLTAVMVFYLAALDFYSVAALLRGSWATRGVARRRMQFAALGLGLLASALVLAGFIVLTLTVLPALQPAALILIQVVAVLSGLAFYVGFAPPRALRRTWQLAELEGFLSASAAMADVPVTEVLHRLATAAVNGVGGRAALILAPPDWRTVAATDQGLADALRLKQQPADYWQDIAAGRARLVEALKNWFTPGSPFAAEAQSALAVPIKVARGTWGVLLVLLRRNSLFPDDDLHLLDLLKTQTSYIIEQQGLIGELRKQTTELEQANRELGTANLELESFTYSVSHDLRTPLRHIEGFAQVIRDAEAVSEAGERPLENILAATGRMARLIDAMLLLSRLGRAELNLTQVPLEALIDLVRHEFEGEVQGRAIAWRVGALPVVPGDPVLLRQVFTNLLSNAIKYTRKRPDAEIEIGTQPGIPGQVVVFVRDNGVGFDSAYAHRLFTVFQRLHHPTEFEGDGIGLANVRRIVQRHGGRVWAESAIDVGATFFVSLPMEQNPSATPATVPVEAGVTA
jgi:signal transduction histidine kinase